ncbi:hypothetical protein Ancab_030117 [Ancistrocladus abbreviatus]
MRGFSTLASRASPATQNFKTKLPNRTPPNNRPKLKKNHIESTHRGTFSSNSLLNVPNISSISITPSSLGHHKLRSKPIDHQYISQLLSRKEWHLLLNHELKGGRIVLKPSISC